MILAQLLTARVLRTAHWMAGLIIAVVMEIVALTASAEWLDWPFIREL